MIGNTGIVNKDNGKLQSLQDRFVPFGAQMPWNTRSPPKYRGIRIVEVHVRVVLILKQAASQSQTYLQ